MTTTVDYNHELNRDLHSVNGALAILERLFQTRKPESVLDVACGLGSWMRAAIELGVPEVRGIEGMDLPEASMYVPKSSVKVADLNHPVDLGRSFDLVICLEAVEHLEPESSSSIVKTLVRHGSHILFSAASPGQAGTHHVNCQWPEFWQRHFNDNGYVCEDNLRWSIWDDQRIEPWYRQNIFQARYDPSVAGTEARIRKVVHPDLLPSFAGMFLPQHVELVESGGMPWQWYVSAPLKAAVAKLKRK
ncbi:MAG: methyltransferase domain-containing protein [Pseudomonadota bacterium]